MNSQIIIQNLVKSNSLQLLQISYRNAVLHDDKEEITWIKQAIRIKKEQVEANNLSNHHKYA